MIRDVQGKANSPLQTFLQINAPFMNTADPASYLGKLGYILDAVVGVDDTVVDQLLYASDMPIDEALSTTNLSVQDVIAHSIVSGFVKTEGLQSSEAEPLMVMLAVPTTATQTATH